MGKKKEPERTRELSQEEWVERFIAYFDAKHCTIFGRSMPTAMPDEKAHTAEWYAALVMDVASGDFGD